MRSQNSRDVVNIGKSVVIKGELNGSEDLTIEGHVEGKIELRDHVLTIGPNGKIKAELFAKSVVVLGEVIGNVSASEKVDIRENGSVDGDITSPRVAIAEGAHFRGSVDMAQKGKAAAGPRPAEMKPQPVPHRSPWLSSSLSRRKRWASCSGIRAAKNETRRRLRPPRSLMRGQTFPTKALRKFLATLTSRESPVLMDLGPVVGSNVTFFGERLGCKIILEDLFADLDRYPKNSETPFAEYLKTPLETPGRVASTAFCAGISSISSTCGLRRRSPSR